MYMVFDDVGGGSIRHWLSLNPPLVQRFHVAIKVTPFTVLLISFRPFV
jgi:hypothetical protein